jgi:Ni/Co efflux regulator RcnB
MRKFLVALLALSMMCATAALGEAATTTHSKSHAKHQVKRQGKTRSKGKSFKGSNGKKRGYSKSKHKTGGSAKQLKTK